MSQKTLQKCKIKLILGINSKSCQDRYVYRPRVYLVLPSLVYSCSKTRLLYCNQLIAVGQITFTNSYIHPFPPCIMCLCIMSVNVCLCLCVCVLFYKRSGGTQTGRGINEKSTKQKERRGERVSNRKRGGVEIQYVLNFGLIVCIVVTGYNDRNERKWTLQGTLRKKSQLNTYNIEVVWKRKPRMVVRPVYHQHDTTRTDVSADVSSV